jgi:hypothetical protein
VFFFFFDKANFFLGASAPSLRVIDVASSPKCRHPVTAEGMCPLSLSSLGSPTSEGVIYIQVLIMRDVDYIINFRLPFNLA